MPLSGELGEWQNQFHTGIGKTTPQINNCTPFKSDIINLESRIIKAQKIMEKRVRVWF